MATRVKNGVTIWVNDRKDEIDAEGARRVANETKTIPAFSSEVIAESNRASKRAAAKEYLSRTDWYAVRKAETGKAIPSDVLTKREQARIDASK